MVSSRDTWRGPGHINTTCIAGCWGIEQKVRKIVSQVWLWRPADLWDGSWRLQESTQAAGKITRSGGCLGELLLGEHVCLCARQDHLWLATRWTRGLSPFGGGIHPAYVYALPMNGPSSRSAREGDRMKPLVPSVLTWVLLSVSTCICVFVMRVLEYMLSLTVSWIPAHGVAAASPPLAYCIGKLVRF